MPLDTTKPAGLLQLQEQINSELRIRAGVRAKALDGCYSVQEATRAKNSKSLHIGSLEMTEVTDAKADIDSGEITVGATYLPKAEYAQEILFPGSMLRYAERDPVPKTVTRLMEADDHLLDVSLMDALVGPMYTGSSASPSAVNNVFNEAHGGTGITPAKITAAATAVRRFMPGAKLIVGITPDIYQQMTAFDEFTNGDFMVDSFGSVYGGKLMQSRHWFDVMFKIIPDFVKEDATQNTQELVATVPAERYINGGNWVADSWVRKCPVWAVDAVDYEEMMAPQVEVFDVWKQRKKPKGTLACRIDHEFGFARNNPYGAAFFEVIEVNPYLTGA